MSLKLNRIFFNDLYNSCIDTGIADTHQDTVLFSFPVFNSNCVSGSASELPQHNCESDNHSEPGLSQCRAQGSKAPFYFGIFFAYN